MLLIYVACLCFFWEDILMRSFMYTNTCTQDKLVINWVLNWLTILRKCLKAGESILVTNKYERVD